MWDAMGLAKLRKIHCLFLYVCVPAGRKDIPDQNAGGKIVFSVSFGYSSNPKEGISPVNHHSSHGVQGFLPCKMQNQGLFPCKTCGT